MICALISRSSTPVLTISGARASNSSSRGTSVPMVVPELGDRVVNDSELRPKLTAGAGRVECRKQCSQKRRRTGSNG